MNTESVISADSSTDLRGKEFYVVKIASTGIDLCGSTATAIGTLVRGQDTQENGVYTNTPVAVQRRYNGIHYATIGTTTATSVAKGDTLAIDAANAGKLIPSGSSVVAQAWQAATITAGSVIRAIFV